MKREVERHTTKFGTSGGSGKANKLQTNEQWNSGTYTIDIFRYKKH